MIYTLTGSNTFALSTRLTALEQAARDSGAGIEKIDASTLDSPLDIVTVVSSVSLFEPQKLIIIRSLHSIAEHIEQVIERTHENNTVVFVEPGLDKRSKLHKYLKETTDYSEFSDVQGPQLRTWLTDYCNELGAQIDTAAVNELIARVGEDQQAIAQELQVLALSSETITKDLVDEYVEARPQSKIFDLLDAAFSGAVSRVEKLYAEQRAQGEEPQKIMGMITWQLNQLFKAHAAGSQAELITAGVSSYSASKVLRLAQSIDAQKTQRAIDMLVEVDSHIKSGADADTALLSYLTGITTS